jgi:hypothetical protein
VFGVFFGIEVRSRADILSTVASIVARLLRFENRSFQRSVQFDALLFTFLIEFGFLFVRPFATCLIVFGLHDLERVHLHRGSSRIADRTFIVAWLTYSCQAASNSRLSVFKSLLSARLKVSLATRYTSTDRWYSCAAF